MHNPWVRIRTAQIRGNLDMAANDYRIFQSGMRLAETENYPDTELAINLGQVFASLAGIPIKNATFGMAAF